MGFSLLLHLPSTVVILADSSMVVAWQPEVSVCRKFLFTRERKRRAVLLT
jgi:hypothetical protein